MSATTIKVEGKLLDELKKARPSEQSLSSFVRSVLEKELLRRRMTDAAERYLQFIRENPDEKEWLDEWGQANLDQPVEQERR